MCSRPIDKYGPNSSLRPTRNSSISHSVAFKHIEVRKKAKYQLSFFMISKIVHAGPNRQ